MTSTIADRLSELRMNKGSSKEEIAELVGVSVDKIDSWEAGYSLPNSELMDILAKYYDVPFDYILRGNAAGANKIISANKFMVAAVMAYLLAIAAMTSIWVTSPAIAVLFWGFFAFGSLLIYNAGVNTAQDEVAPAQYNYWTTIFGLLLLIPTSLVYNIIFTDYIRPYPVFTEIPIFIGFWAFYLVLFIVVIVIRKVLKKK